MLSELWIIVDREGGIVATDGRRPLTEEEARAEAGYLDISCPIARPHAVKRFTLAPDRAPTPSYAYPGITRP